MYQTKIIYIKEFYGKFIQIIKFQLSSDDSIDNSTADSSTQNQTNRLLW